MPDVICMGEFLVELVSTQPNVSLVQTPGFVKAAGGAPANVAVALKRLGMDAGFIGKVGDDPMGTFLRQSLERDGVDTSTLLVDPDVRTTVLFNAVWDDGRKDLCFYRNPGADMMLREDEIVPEMLAGARGFHYGSITFIDEPAASAQWKALRLAHEQGLMISYDPNYRPTLWPSVKRTKSVIREGFRHCHLAKVSEEEWDVTTGHSDIEAGLDAVLDLGPEMVVLSRGSKGALVTNGTYVLDVPGLTVDVVETTGAGDGFMAAMILKLLPERERLGSLARIERAVVEDALHFANAVGALTCTRPGAIPALPTLDEVLTFLQTAN